MFRAPKTLLSLILVLVAGLTVSACGEDRSHLFPSENVTEISASIDTIQQLVDQGQCFEALEATDPLQAQAESLPSTVDPKLKRSLIDGVVTLTILVGRQCEDDPSTGTTGDTEPEETDTEVTPTGETGPTDEEEGPTGPTGKKDDQETEPTPNPNKPTKEPKTPTPEKTPPANPTPPETTPPDETGPGSGGISPNP